MRQQATVAHLTTQGANASHIADTAVSTWRRVDAALTPIVGPRGVAALFKRSLNLARAAHPGLAAVDDQANEPDAYAALRGALAQQTPAAASAAHDALLLTFRDLLGKLIGAPLTERLLQPVSDSPSSGPAAQDTSP
ncbi:hypothetical protein [Piscinibacter sp.]|uniref:hypothetical protein n=1 Tax=Piscinibacter sp. TaxID=1903157 RepID=UPI002D7FE9A3|nr:hypothetical protein [Albitalea sp.]